MERILNTEPGCSELLVLLTPWGIKRPYVLFEISCFRHSRKRIVSINHGLTVDEIMSDPYVGVLLDHRVISAIESAIKDSDFLVLLVGDDLLSSRNAMYELGFAASEQRTRNVTLLPALLPGATDKSIPAYLRRFPSIDGREMSEKEVAEKIADQIVMATNSGAAAAGTPG